MTASLSTVRTIVSSTTPATARSRPVAPARREATEARPLAPRRWLPSVRHRAQPMAPTAISRQGALSRRADRAEALGADLVEGVLGRVPVRARRGTRARTRNRSGRAPGRRPRERHVVVVDREGAAGEDLRIGVGEELRREPGPSSARTGRARSQSPTMSNSTIARISSSGGIAPSPPRLAASRRTAVLPRLPSTENSRSPRASSPSKSAIASEGPGSGCGSERASSSTTATPGGAVVGPDEARDPVLGVVVGAEDDVAGLRAGQRCRRRCAAGCCDASRPRRPASSSSSASSSASPRSRRRAGRARAELDLGLEVGEGPIGVEAPVGAVGAWSWRRSPPQPATSRRSADCDAPRVLWRRPRTRDTLGPWPRVTWTG